MSELLGMSEAEVRRSVGMLRQLAGDLEALHARARGAVRVLGDSWGGEDAAALAGEWSRSGTHALTEARAGLREMADTLEAQADGQRRASGEGGGAYPGGGGATGPGGSGGATGPGGSGTAPGQVPKLQIKHQARSKDSLFVEQVRLPDGTVLHIDKMPGSDRMWVEHPDGRTEAYTGERFGYTDAEGNRVTVDGDGNVIGSGRQFGGERAFDNRYTQFVDGDSGAARAADVGRRLAHDDTVSVDIWSQGGNAKAEASVFGNTWGTGDDRLTVEALSADASAQGKFGVSDKGLMAAGAVGAGAYLGRVKGQFHAGPAFGSGQAYVGGEAKARGSASIGLTGAHANVQAGAFVGGKVEGQIGLEAGGVKAGVGGELSFGIGAHAEIGGEVSLDKVAVNVDIGATLGIGAGLELDVEVDPGEVVDDVGNAIGDGAEAVGDFLTPW